MIKLYRKLLHKHLSAYIAGFWLLGLVSGTIQIFQIFLISEIVNKTIEKQEDVMNYLYQHAYASLVTSLSNPSMID